jgi:hypothetical protein
MTGLIFLTVKNLGNDFVKTLDNLMFCATLAARSFSRRPTQGTICLFSTGFQRITMLGILTNTPQWI